MQFLEGCGKWEDEGIVEVSELYKARTWNGWTAGDVARILY